MNIRELLRQMVSRNASDLHMKVNSYPIFRINKELIPQKQLEKITSETMSRIIEEITPEDIQRTFREKNEVDFSCVIKDVGRFRINIFRQRGECGIVMRHVKEIIPSFEELNLPEIFKNIASIDTGIILVTGASSSGKSTTLAAMVDYINTTKNKHIMTLENPIEYIHKDKRSVINQREIGIDTESFHMALRHIIRQDPDVVVIGEMRDKEGIMTSISIAETGHLVLSSFHAEDTVQAIVRLLDFFADSEKDYIRMQLGSTLKAITSQRLLKKADIPKNGSSALIPATEVLIVNPIVSKLIRDNKIRNIYKVLQTGEDGMHSFNISLAQLCQKKLASRQEVLSKSSNPEALKINLKGIYLDEDKGILG